MAQQFREKMEHQKVLRTVATSKKKDREQSSPPQKRCKGEDDFKALCEKPGYEDVKLLFDAYSHHQSHLETMVQDMEATTKQLNESMDVLHASILVNKKGQRDLMKGLDSIAQHILQKKVLRRKEFEDSGEESEEDD